MRWGVAELRSPHPLIDLRHIRETDPTLLPEKPTIEALYALLCGDLIDPSPLFSLDYYRSQLDDAADTGFGPAAPLRAIRVAGGPAPASVPGPDRVLSASTAPGRSTSAPLCATLPCPTERQTAAGPCPPRTRRWRPGRNPCFAPRQPPCFLPTAATSCVSTSTGRPISAC